ncbi:MAG: hypothetical protein KF850_15850 [Labilithrix sp.]|nr:hypothetical protein [Labilithrix sp.]
MLLDWIAPPECPAEQAVVAQVTTMVGESLAAEPLVVHARIDRGGARAFQLHLRIGEEEESLRTLESDDCAELAQATALIVSLDLQSRAKAAAERPKAPAATEAPQEGSPSGDATVTAPPPARTPAEAPPARAGAPAPRAAAVGVGAELFADAGSLATTAWGSGVMAFFTQGPLRGELGATLWPRSRALASNHPGAGASLYLRTIGLRGCVSVAPSLHVDACIHAEGGSARATGFGISRPTTSNGRWLAAFAGLTARPVTWAELTPRFTVEIGTPLHFATVAIEGLGQVYAPSPVLLRVAAGLETKLF